MLGRGRDGRETADGDLGKPSLTAAARVVKEGGQINQGKRPS